MKDKKRKDSKYQNLKLPIKTIQSVVTILEDSGIEIRNDTEAINIILSNFIIQKNIMLPLIRKHQKGKIQKPEG